MNLVDSIPSIQRYMDDIPHYSEAYCYASLEEDEEGGWCPVVAIRAKFAAPLEQVSVTLKIT